MTCLFAWAPSIRPGMSATVSVPPSEYTTVPSCGRRVVKGYDATCGMSTTSFSVIQKGSIAGIDAWVVQAGSFPEIQTQCCSQRLQAAGAERPHNLMHTREADRESAVTCGVAREMPRSSVLLPALGKPTRPTSASSFISSTKAATLPASYVHCT